jgi:predicted nucleotidyltransferase
MTTIHLKTPLPEGKRAVLIIMDRVSRLTNLQYIDFTIRLRLERAFRWIWFRSAVSRVPPRTWRGRRTWQS